MKKQLYLVMLSPLIMQACAPVYKCGEQTADQKVKGGKRLKALVAERDSLCSYSAMKQKEADDLGSSLRKKNSEYDQLTASNNDLQSKYNDLVNQNLSQTDQYNKTLKAKSDELSAKEKLLMEREKALQEMKKIIARQDSITNRLNNILRDALLGFNSDELQVEIRNGKVYVSMSDKLLFRSGSAEVEKKGVEALKVLGEVLDKNRDIDILVEGHTDNVPIKTAMYKDNWDLSVARATSIVRILNNDYKISPSRLTASGKGEYFPRASNDTPEGKARNRRTEIILSPKLDELMNLLKGR